MNVNYELIGSIPAMESFRYTLDEVFARYVASTPTPEQVKAKFAEHIKARDEGRLSSMLDGLFEDPKVVERMTDGAVIAMCAEHFYGLRAMDFDSTRDLIDAIVSLEQELRAK
jgi:hypothetical protein